MTSRAAYVAGSAALLESLLAAVESARHSVVLQMYLLAGNHDLVLLTPRAGIEAWAERLVRGLIEKKRRDPHVEVVVLLDTQTPDDASRTRKGRRPLARHLLEEAGIPVLNANLFGSDFDPRRRFPPAARFHAGAWREVGQDGYVAAQQAWQTWHNVEDHRKNLVVDLGRLGAVTSHNAIDVASDWHDNLLLVSGDGGRAVWNEVRAALGEALALPQRLTPEQRARVEALAKTPPAPGEAAQALSATALAPANVSLYSSRGIRPELERAIDAVEPGGAIDVASTYFSDVALLERLMAAAERGVNVRVLIDDVHGLPLPPFERWFVRTFVNLRCLLHAAVRRPPRFELRVHASGHGAMMHLKTAAFLGARRFLIGGQANYTPNTFCGAWLDTVLEVHSEACVAAFHAQFEPLWSVSTPVAPLTPARRFGALFYRALLRLSEALGFRP